LRLREIVHSLTDLPEVIGVSRRVESARRMGEPARIIDSLRTLGASKRARSEPARRNLRRLVGLVDRCYLSGPNCFRRVLTEVAMDANAAREPVHLGLRAHGGRDSGHAWLGHQSNQSVRYDAEFVI
jgi:hypothetical protein